MSRVFCAAAICVMTAHALTAQAAPPGAAAKRAAQNAVSATNAHIANEQRVDAPVQPPAQRPTAAAVSSANGAAAPAAKPSKVVAGGKRAGQSQLSVASPSDTGVSPVVIMREVFDYARDGRRDPFVSLLTTSELRPAMSDLRLTTIIYDVTGRHSLVVLRDLGTKEQYRVATGAILGRMRITAIRPSVVVFSIDEFGTNRLDSLVLGDTTKARIR